MKDAARHGWRPSVLSALLLAAGAMAARAEPEPMPNAEIGATPAAGELAEWVKLDGFGTLGAYRSNDAVASMRPDARNANASLRDWRFDGDSQLSGQLTLNPNGPLRLVWQVLAKDDIVLHFRPRTEWLYLGWETSTPLSLRAGRLALPVFMLSETRNVAYALTNVRPYSSLYHLNPITKVDGLGAIWRHTLGPGELSLDAVHGRAKVDLTTGRIKARAITALAAQWRQGHWSLRLGRSEYQIDAQLPATLAQLQVLASGATGCANCASVLSARAPAQVRAVIDTGGFNLEQGAWTLSGEWMRRRSDSILVADANAWYAQLSRRMGAFTPFLGIGQTRFVEAALGFQSAAGAPPAAQAANAAFDRFLQSANGRRSWQAGLRWDFAENLALKLHYEWLKNTQEIRLGQTGSVSYPAPPPIGSYRGPSWDGQLRVLSLNLDFVF